MITRADLSRLERIPLALKRAVEQPDTPPGVKEGVRIQAAELEAIIASYHENLDTQTREMGAYLEELQRDIRRRGCWEDE